MYNFIGGFMWLDRLEKILNSDCIQLLKNKTVLIIGIGGVGGSALESIGRMGINNVIIVDPASDGTDLWSSYEWGKTSQFNYFKAN